MNHQPTSQPSTLNPQLACPTYPARPINGGPLDKALPKSGDPASGTGWFYEPKYNGWRTLVHVPTGTMFNRKGERLSINDEFKIATKKLQQFEITWADCEALERRHQLGRGSLVLLDLISQASESYRVRHKTIVQMCYFLGVDCLDPNPDIGVRENEIYFAPAVENHGAGTSGGRLEFQMWNDCKQANHALDCEFFEGLVAKRADSIYPVQLRSPDKEFPFWVKHRWAF